MKKKLNLGYRIASLIISIAVLVKILFSYHVVSSYLFG